jgi:hypothetical protein
MKFVNILFLTVLGQMDDELNFMNDPEAPDSQPVSNEMGETYMEPSTLDADAQMGESYQNNDDEMMSDE